SNIQVHSSRLNVLFVSALASTFAAITVTTLRFRERCLADAAPRKRSSPISLVDSSTHFCRGGPQVVSISNNFHNIFLIIHLVLLTLERALSKLLQWPATQPFLGALWKFNIVQGIFASWPAAPLSRIPAVRS